MAQQSSYALMLTGGKRFFIRGQPVNEVSTVSLDETSCLDRTRGEPNPTRGAAQRNLIRCLVYSSVVTAGVADAYRVNRLSPPHPRLMERGPIGPRKSLGAQWDQGLSGSWSMVLACSSLCASIRLGAVSMTALPISNARALTRSSSVISCLTVKAPLVTCSMRSA